MSTSPNWVECLRASSECTFVVNVSPPYGFVDATIIGTVYDRNSYEITFPANGNPKTFTLSWNGVDAWVGYSGATPITKLVQDIPIPVGAFGQWVPFDANSPASCISSGYTFYTDLSRLQRQPFHQH